MVRSSGRRPPTIEEWREHVAADRGISLCPASPGAFRARPVIVFVPAREVLPISPCVAWRADGMRPEVLAFVQVAASAGAPAGVRTSRDGVKQRC